MTPNPNQTTDALSGWQPIETAPRTGVRFDIWVATDDGGYRVADVWFNVAGQLCRSGVLANLPRWPSHWRAAPPPPGADA